MAGKMKLFLSIIGEPKPKQSARFYHTGAIVKSYQTTDVKANESNIKMQVISQLPADFQVTARPIKVTRLHYVFAPIKSLKKSDLKAMSEGELIYKPTKPDLTDNLNKGVFDALQGIIYANDSQVISMDDVKKIYGHRPRIDIELEIL